MIKKKMIGISEKVFLLADSSKFGVQPFTFVGELQQFAEVVTDDQISTHYLKQLKEKGVKITMFKHLFKITFKKSLSSPTCLIS